MRLKLCHQRDTYYNRTIVSNKENFETKLFRWFYSSEIQNKSKIQGKKLTETKI